MHIWHRLQLQHPEERTWWASAGLLAIIVAIGLACALFGGCGASSCVYDARFDGREPDPDNGVYPYYLVAQCPGEVTQTLVESATRLHVPR